MKPLVKGGIYRHYKGEYYRLISPLTNATLNHPAILYEALYGKKEQYVRSEEDFTSIVKLPNANVRRFTFVANNMKEFSDDTLKRLSTLPKELIESIKHNF